MGISNVDEACPSRPIQTTRPLCFSSYRSLPALELILSTSWLYTYAPLLVLDVQLRRCSAFCIQSVLSASFFAFRVEYNSVFFICDTHRQSYLPADLLLPTSHR